ncbi:MAG: CAAX prenyl protease-related protein [Gemmatimonadaceae bacterium]
MTAPLYDSSIEAPYRRTIAWVGPFAVFAAWLVIDKSLPIANPAKELLRDAVLLASIVGFSWRILPRAAPHWLASIGLGLAVCAMWIAPDVLFPAWRSHWLFQNAIVGHLRTSIPVGELTPLMLVLRTARAALLVPVIEELFWRGWLPRWLQDTSFWKLPLGAYSAFAFWSTAVLFALEHGSYWEVGLLCGVIYNWWMRRTRSLGDLVVVHAVTNLALSLYVMTTGSWVFWM